MGGSEAYEYWAIIMYGDQYDNDTYHERIIAYTDAEAWEIADKHVANSLYTDPAITGMFKGT